MEEKIYPNMLIPQMILKDLSRKIIHIYGEVTEDSMFEAMYNIRKVVRIYDLEETPIKNRVINIYIDSFGGAVYECLGVVNLLLNLKKQGYTINTYCMAKSMSCGLIIFSCGTNRYIYPYSTLLYHSVSSVAYGKLNNIKNDYEESKRLDDISKDIILKNTTVSKEVLDKCTETTKDWYIDSKHALELGFATEIL